MFKKRDQLFTAYSFLRDACQSRPESIEHFQEDLSALIVDLIGGKDLLAAKIAAEALPIVTPSARTQGITKAFKRRISWLSETALRSCRHLPELEPQAVEVIRQYIQELPTPALLKSFSDLGFSLSLSDSLRSVRLIHRADTISLLILWIALSIFFVYSSVASFSTYFFWTFATTVLLLEVGHSFFGVLLFERVNSPKRIVPKRKAGIIFMLPFRPGFDSSIRMTILYWIALSNLLPIFILPLRLRMSPFTLSWEIDLLAIVIAFPSVFWIFVANSCVNLKFSLSWIQQNLKLLLVTIGKLLLMILLTGPVIWVVFLVLKGRPWISFVFIFSVLVFGIIRGVFNWIPDLIIGFWKIIKDRRLIKQLNSVDELTWAALCQTTNRFLSDWGQSRYLEMLRTQKIQITDLDAISPQLSLVGLNAEAEMARLKEQIYDLQE